MLNNNLPCMCCNKSQEHTKKFLHLEFKFIFERDVKCSGIKKKEQRKQKISKNFSFPVILILLFVSVIVIAVMK